MQQNLKSLEEWRNLAASTTDFYSPAVDFIDRKITQLGAGAVVACDENHFILMCGHIHATELSKQNGERKSAGTGRSIRDTLRALSRDALPDNLLANENAGRSGAVERTL